MPSPAVAAAVHCSMLHACKVVQPRKAGVIASPSRMSQHWPAALCAWTSAKLRSAMRASILPSLPRQYSCKRVGTGHPSPNQAPSRNAALAMAICLTQVQGFARNPCRRGVPPALVELACMHACACNGQDALRNPSPAATAGPGPLRLAADPTAGARQSQALSAPAPPPPDRSAPCRRSMSWKCQRSWHAATRQGPVDA